MTFNVKTKIAVVTGNRAEYGALYWILDGIKNVEKFNLQLIVTGAHLSQEYGLTYRFIENDGFKIDYKVEPALLNNTHVGVIQSMGHIIAGMAEALNDLKPDLLVIPGDRYEMLAVAQAALIMRIPIAHIAGGDTTEGAFDEAIRHSITKMSHIHFVSNEVAARRVRQLGENPDNIFTVGSPALDNITHLKLMTRTELEKNLGIRFRTKNMLITYHPETLAETVAETVAETLDSASPEHQFQPLLNTLESFGQDVTLVFTKANPDPGGKMINHMIDNFAQNHHNAHAYESLGQLRYLSLLAQVDLIAGNSSSGIYEAPSLKKPTVNIGDRQKGRIQAKSVINCSNNQKSIETAIKKALVLNCSDVINPYGDGQSSARIISILKNYDDFHHLLKKHFFDSSQG